MVLPFLILTPELETAIRETRVALFERYQIDHGTYKKLVELDHELGGGKITLRECMIFVDAPSTLP